MGLNAVDWGFSVAYLAGVTLFGLRFKRRKQTLKNYFLADRNIPWWAICLSIVAAETSTLTIISVPGLAFDQDFRFLQLIIGYVIGRVIVSVLLIPHYFKGNLVTAYELMERRFGGELRTLTAWVFVLTRAAAEGVRVFAVAIVVRVALGTLMHSMSDFERDLCAIGIVTALTLLYTLEGGIKAVIWTDVAQLGIYLAGTLAAVFTILHLIPGGWNTAVQTAGAAGKFRMFDFTWSLHSNYTFWSGVIGGTFLIMATHGADQLIVQRLLCARNERDSKIALVSSGFVVFAQFALFLLVGALLYVLYRQFPPASAFTRSDAVFPTFIVSRLPHGVGGLLIAAILAAAMSNLSAALNSLSSSTVLDLYARLRPRSNEEKRLRLSRIATAGWAVALFGLALLARNGGKVLETGLSIASVAFGALLGVFLLGILTRRATERGAIAGMLAGLAVNCYLWLGTSVAYTWYVLLGCAATFVVGYAASVFTLVPTRNPTYQGK